jgi:hypothetical protein
LIAALAPLLELLNDSPVFIGRELHATVLELAGESAQS